ncbi:MAG: site-2 protease family protein [Solirubrobacteraceae bacterium]|nr:site-2 protease family protein [Solirubrobacteraceae bacterium]
MMEANMFGRLSFGSVRGIPITASSSWLVVVFVLIWFLGDHLFEITTASRTAATLLAAVAVLLFFASVVAHELGHAFAALRAGLKVDGIELWMFGGFARLKEAPRTPGEQFKIAVAGPLVTLLLAVLFLGSAFLIDAGSLGSVAEGERTDPYLAIAVLLGTLNVAVLVLNLLPAYPLDGGVIARSIAWKITGDPHKATRWAATAGLVIGGGLVSGGVFLLLTSDSQADGFALALLGWLVTIAARGSLDAARRQERLDLVTVGAIADPTVTAVDGHHTVLRATDDGGPPGSWIVVRRPTGPPALIAAAAIEEAMAKGQPALTLAELAEDVGDRTVAGDTSLREVAVDPRLRDGGPLLALSTEGEPLGIVTGNTLREAVVLAARGR